MLVHQGEGSGTPTEPHHTPFPEVESSHPTTSLIPLSSIPTAPIPIVTQTDTTPIIQYSRRARIAQSSALPTVTDEPVSLVRDDSQGEACPTDSGFIADQDRATIANSSTLPHDLVLRVTSPAADEGKDKEAVATKQSGEDALIKGRSNNEGEAVAERISNDSEEIARVLTSMDAATVLAGETNVPIGSGFIPTAGPPATVISTGSEVGPTASPIVTRRKGKEVMGEGSGTPSEPYHTPFPEVKTSHPTTSSIPLPSIPTAPIPPVTQPVTAPIIQYSRKARIAQSSALLTVADEPTSPVRDVSEGEACPIESDFIADQDRATIVKSFTLPHDSAPKVPSPAADEGSMQHNISELTALCTSLQRQYSELTGSKYWRIEKVLLPNNLEMMPQSKGGVSMKGRQLLKESVMTQRRLQGKGKEVMVESDTLKKKKLQEQIDAQVARELEEQQEKEDIRMNEQIARDAEVARIHAEE
nr:hypothetical protein [Tanacetum cinerariifolium]